MLDYYDFFRVIRTWQEVPPLLHGSQRSPLYPLTQTGTCLQQWQLHTDRPHQDNRQPPSAPFSKLAPASPFRFGGDLCVRNMKMIRQGWRNEAKLNQRVGVCKNTFDPAYAATVVGPGRAEWVQTIPLLLHSNGSLGKMYTPREAICDCGLQF